MFLIPQKFAFAQKRYFKQKILRAFFKCPMSTKKKVIFCSFSNFGIYWNSKKLLRFLRTLFSTLKIFEVKNKLCIEAISNNIGMSQKAAGAGWYSRKKIFQSSGLEVQYVTVLIFINEQKFLPKRSPPEISSLQFLLSYPQQKNPFENLWRAAKIVKMTLSPSHYHHQVGSLTLKTSSRFCLHFSSRKSSLRFFAAS